MFPVSSNDNRCHLQALRHLYVLSTEPRVLVVRDVRTLQACPVEVCVITLQGEVFMATAPCLLPEWGNIHKVCAQTYALVPISMPSCPYLCPCAQTYALSAMVMYIPRPTSCVQEPFKEGIGLGTQTYSLLPKPLLFFLFTLIMAMLSVRYLFPVQSIGLLNCSLTLLTG